MIKYHLPGLFEFYELYKVFLPVFREHREYFYDWCEIGSIYGAPDDCIWGGGRVEESAASVDEVLALMKQYGISARLTFSNSLLKEEHLDDGLCNKMCKKFSEISDEKLRNGVIVHSDLLLEYIRAKYPELYMVSSTTKVLMDFDELFCELNKPEFDYVVPDFRLNKSLDKLEGLNQEQKDKVEFLCNECCFFGCKDRKKCYESVSHQMLGDDYPEHVCTASGGNKGYVFSKAMTNPGFIGIEDIQSVYEPMGFSNFKIEGRSLGSALVFEFLLYYMVKPQFQLRLRELIYLDSNLDLF